MKKNRYLFFYLLVQPFIGFSQTEIPILTEEKLIWYINKYHPISVQGNLLEKRGEQTYNAAKGAFDPVLHSALDQKYFKEKEYYNILNAGLKVPIWNGVDIKTGFEQNSGVFLNPEKNVPVDGLVYGGISVPLGQGLLLDKRKAALKQAQIYSKATVAEKQKMLNELYYDALKKYWKWIEAYNTNKVYSESVELANTRFKAIKTSYELGDRPAIDTLEAYIQVQNLQLNQYQSDLNYKNTTLELSNFLWYENNTPLVITDKIVPPEIKDLKKQEVISSSQLDDFINNLEKNHPDLLIYNFKINSLEIEKRLKAEYLRPKLNVNYNLLNERIGSDLVNNLSLQNYKWGFDFSLPLFLRQQRGEFQLSKLKLQDASLERQQKLLELQNKLKGYFNEQLTLNNQVSLFTNAVINYSKLLEGERQNFMNGESSIFLVNSREISLIQAKLKLIELISKYNISHTSIKYATGNILNN